MAPSTYSIMQRFTPEALIDVYSNKYIFEHGEKKLAEVVQKVESSPTAIQFINFHLQNGRIPAPKDLQLILNTMRYFMFSKAETLCLGGLAIILLLKMKKDMLNDTYLEEDVVECCAQFILDISKTKTNFRENFFGRFFSEIDRIGREEEY